MLESIRKQVRSCRTAVRHEAIIESDRPVVVVAAFDAGGGGDAIMLYDGVTIP